MPEERRDSEKGDFVGFAGRKNEALDKIPETVQTAQRNWPLPVKLAAGLGIKKGKTGTFRTLTERYMAKCTKTTGNSLREQ